jgi:hypothetical protein
LLASLVHGSEIRRPSVAALFLEDAELGVRQVIAAVAVASAAVVAVAAIVVVRGLLETLARADIVELGADRARITAKGLWMLGKGPRPEGRYLGEQPGELGES